MSTAVTRGIDRLLRLDFPASTSEIELKRHDGRTVNALEMVEALKVMYRLFSDTSETIGKPMYRGESDFDFTDDIKRGINQYFLVGEDEKHSALRRRKNRTMVVLMLNPLVDLFHHHTHEDMLEQYTGVIDDAIQHIFDSDIEPTADDAFVVRAVITKEIAKRNRIQSAVDGIMRMRRRKKKRKSKK